MKTTTNYGVGVASARTKAAKAELFTALHANGATVIVVNNSTKHIGVFARIDKDRAVVDVPLPTQPSRRWWPLSICVLVNDFNHGRDAA